MHWPMSLESGSYYGRTSTVFCALCAFSGAGNRSFCGSAVSMALWWVVRGGCFVSFNGPVLLAEIDQKKKLQDMQQTSRGNQPRERSFWLSGTGISGRAGALKREVANVTTGLSSQNF